MNRLGRAMLPTHGRTFGWYRVYNTFVGHPKWRAIARATNIELVRVQAIVTALLGEANQAMPRGSLADFDVFDCAANLEVEPEEVARIYAELEHRQWIVHDHIATWAKRQPDREDPEATERKQRSRDNLKATRRMLAEPPVSLDLPPADETGEAAAIARSYWLQTIGKELVAGRLGIKAMQAQVIIHGWMREARKAGATNQGAYEVVANIVKGAIDMGLQRELFRDQVSERIAATRQQATPGQRALPLLQNVKREAS